MPISTPQRANATRRPAGTKRTYVLNGGVESLRSKVCICQCHPYNDQERKPKRCSPGSSEPSARVDEMEIPGALQAVEAIWQIAYPRSAMNGRHSPKSGLHARRVALI